MEDNDDDNRPREGKDYEGPRGYKRFYKEWWRERKLKINLGDDEDRGDRNVEYDQHQEESDDEEGEEDDENDNSKF